MSTDLNESDGICVGTDLDQSDGACLKHETTEEEVTFVSNMSIDLNKSDDMEQETTEEKEAMQDATEGGENVKPVFKIFNPYTEFHELTRKEIKSYEATFKKYDCKKDGFLDLEELKRMMEELGAPQTHLALKGMIKEVDEDEDGKISFREFLLIFRRAKAGELETDSGLSQLAKLTEVDVKEVGVGGAKNFFEAKIEELKISSKFEHEIKKEQEEKKQMEEEKKQRKIEFKNIASMFNQN